ncbi:MAG: hypothetical protein PHC37_07295 [Candidatus Omnitrophica bacterium]|nr:hypothetical protein [Candidatus Omnitrophota bacterium]
MDKNVVYVAVFGVLCVLAGVLVGAGITKNRNLPWRGPERPDFSERAERFMRHGPRDTRERKTGVGPIKMLTVKLGLNAGQKAKIAEILENTRQEIDRVGKNIRSAIIEIKEKGDKQIMGVLTPQQQEEFKALQNEFEAGRGSRGPEMEPGKIRGFGPGLNEELPVTQG